VRAGVSCTGCSVYAALYASYRYRSFPRCHSSMQEKEFADAAIVSRSLSRRDVDAFGGRSKETKAESLIEPAERVSRVFVGD